MILCRKPIPIYDVDLIGVAVLAVTALAAWLCAVVPWREAWRTQRALATRYAVAQQQLQTNLGELQQLQSRLAQVQNFVNTQQAQVPHPGALSHMLREMTEIAKDERLELLAVTPQPAAREGAYVVNDIQVVGRGASHDFIRFLDQFARRNPYQYVRHGQLRRDATAPSPTCELHWTVRFYMLPIEPNTPAGGTL